MTRLADRVWVANAPVSYGAFEVTVGKHPRVPAAETVLEEVAGAGYRGIDLGPHGYLGLGHELVTRLHRYDLHLAGGFLELPFSMPDEFGHELRELDALLDVLDQTNDQAAPPRPTLSDLVRSVERQRWPGRAARDRSFGLNDSAWGRFAERVQRASDHCRARGYEPSFHHHTASYVEATWEIERLLELTDVNLCLDTGHLLLGWGNPETVLRDWSSRVNHIHLKDAQLDVLERILKEGAPLGAIWEAQAFCPLGRGDVDLDAFLTGLDEVDYRGWIVVEQDVVLEADDDLPQAIRDQRGNRKWLRERGI